MTKVGTLAVATVLSGIAACSGSGGAPSTAPSFKDGTRLKAVYQRIDGAPPLFLNWYDTELQTDCTFVDLARSDGRPVCFPTDPVGSNEQFLFASPLPLFTDGACTQQLVNATYPSCAPRFAFTAAGTANGCDVPVRLSRVGPVLQPDPGSLFAPGSDGLCHSATEAAPGYTELHTLGEEIPIDSLVTGTFRPATGKGRIVPLQIVGSDGSIQGEATLGAFWEPATSIAWDTARGEKVSTTLRPGSRWIPTTQYTTGVFSDAACSDPAAIGPACHVDAKEAFTYATDECGYVAPTTFYELGSQFAGTSIYSDYSAPCTFDNDATKWVIENPMLGVFSTGEPVPPTAFAEARQVHTGTGQLQVVRAGSAGDAPAISVGLFDTVHGQPCSFARKVQAADGVVRCLPNAAIAPITYFADAACQVPLFMASATSDPCSPAPAFLSTAEWLGSYTGCETPVSRQHLYPIGGVYTGEVYFALGDGQCFDLGGADQWNGLVHATGPEVPPSEFAALDYVRPN